MGEKGKGKGGEGKDSGLKFFMRPAITRAEFRLPEIDFALGLAAPGGLTSGFAMHF